MADFAERIRELRGSLTQDAVSDLVGVSESMVGKWERGASVPSVESLHAIADATGASIDYILGRPDATFAGPPKWWPSEAPDGQPADADAALGRLSGRLAGKARRREAGQRSPGTRSQRPTPGADPPS